MSDIINKPEASVLAVIPARGGSKGILRKNIVPLGGRPLIAWTIEAALTASCISRVIVTTDDSEIADIAFAAGADVPFLRPEAIASDTASSADVLAHAIELLPGYDYAVLLQPTSPLRTGQDIDAAFSMWQSQGGYSCASVTEASESPWLMFHRTPEGKLERLLEMPGEDTRRQCLPVAFMLNGAIYFVKSNDFMRDRRFIDRSTVGYLMPADRSIDIDTISDLELASTMLDRRYGWSTGAI
jgi:CMP-N,N'-diacetyllegionaminic acid synthase